MYINIREKNSKDYYVNYYYYKTQHNPKLLVNVMSIIDNIIPDNSKMSWKEFMMIFDKEIVNCDIIRM